MRPHSLDRDTLRLIELRCLSIYHIRPIRAITRRRARKEAPDSLVRRLERIVPYSRFAVIPGIALRAAWIRVLPALGEVPVTIIGACWNRYRVRLRIAPEPGGSDVQLLAARNFDRL